VDIERAVAVKRVADAASSSWILKERWLLKELHDSHSLHGSASSLGFVQLIDFANILAHVVLPTPRGPQKR